MQFAAGGGRPEDWLQCVKITWQDAYNRCGYAKKIWRAFDLFNVVIGCVCGPRWKVLGLQPSFAQNSKAGRAF